MRSDIIRSLAGRTSIPATWSTFMKGRALQKDMIVYYLLFLHSFCNRETIHNRKILKRVYIYKKNSHSVSSEKVLEDLNGVCSRQFLDRNGFHLTRGVGACGWKSPKSLVHLCISVILELIYEDTHNNNHNKLGVETFAFKLRTPGKKFSGKICRFSLRFALWWRTSQGIRICSRWWRLTLYFTSKLCTFSLPSFGSLAIQARAGKKTSRRLNIFSGNDKSVNWPPPARNALPVLSASCDNTKPETHSASELSNSLSWRWRHYGYWERFTHSASKNISLCWNKIEQNKLYIY